MRLSGRVALITGGSRGIGKATARIFAAEGAQVAITGRDDGRLQEAARELGVPGFAGDIRRSADVGSVVGRTMDRFGRIDILVNNAGIFPEVMPLHETPEEKWTEVIDVNLTGQFRYTKSVIPHMMEGGGCIINVSSDAGLRSFENFEADSYSAAKAAIIHLTRAWAVEYARYRIRVNCVCPGIVETDMTEPFLRTEADRAMAVAEHPIGRIGSPDDVARSILYFASEESSWVTGAVLPVDGGVSVK
ncbi:MAG: SDR family oxidoreductase [Thaumarchaeota archaeon]|nr:SDR family oxidoreductase [Nitrososphaerota archaeon]